jgi:hypothetical protein
VWVSLKTENDTRIIIAWKIDVDQNIQRQVVRPAMKPPIIGPVSSMLVVWSDIRYQMVSYMGTHTDSST